MKLQILFLLVATTCYLAQAQEHDWTSYQTLDEINAWLDGLVEKHPGVVTPIVGGATYEGREIRGVKVSFGPGNKGVFLEGGIHGREWIAPATVTYILNQLLSSTDESVRKVAESRDWHVFPVINPDGYVFTHTTNRLWKKTRKPNGSCYGVDLSRNWAYHWLEGAPLNPICAQDYAGSSPFSEIETQSLSEYITSVADTLDTYLAFQSYGQNLLIPFGHPGDKVPENNEELLRIGNAAAESLAVRHGTRYTVGNFAEVIFPVSGGSVDWVIATHRNVRIAYTFQLRDEGTDGYSLPPNQIIPTGEETLDALVTIISEADASL